MSQAETVAEVKPRWIGSAMKRVEDRHLLNADTNFVDDIKFPDVLYVAVLRSPYARAILRSVDTTDALNMPGVVDVITGDDAVRISKPLPSYVEGSNFKSQEYFLAVKQVRYAGEPIAAVAATDPAVAEDAIEAINVEYEPLTPIIDPEEAAKPGSELVYDSFGTNVVAHYHGKWGDIEGSFKEADVVVKEKIKLHRFTSTPLEPVTAVASFNSISGELILHCNAQMVGHVMMVVSDTLNIPTHKFHLKVADIGGGFGIKARPWKQLLIPCALAMKTGRTVKYVETRTEDIMAGGASAGGVFEIEAAAKKDGRILGYRLHDISNDGASLTYAGTYESMRGYLLNGCYRIKNIQWDAFSVLTNTVPSMPNRGVGKPGITYILERMVQFLSEKLGMDPAEVRLKNFIQPDEFPYPTPAGTVYDSGNYPVVLKKALKLADYDGFRKRQLQLRKLGRYVGVGICTYVHGSSGVTAEVEGATVSIDPKGKVLMHAGSPDMGTAHATALTQIAADELGVNPSDVEVVSFDSSSSPWTPYSGTHANKFSGPDVEAAVRACRILRRKVAAIAAKLLNADEESIEVNEGKVSARGNPDRARTLGEVARAAYQNPKFLPEGHDPGLIVTYVGNNPNALNAYRPDAKSAGVLPTIIAVAGPAGGGLKGFMTYPNSAHIVQLEVDAETGRVEIMKYFIVHDSGREINPMVVEGQVQGNAAFAVGTALFEGLNYDSGGQLLNPTFMDYLKPTTMEVPDLVIDRIETPSPNSILGIKGVGEGEALGPLAAIANGIEDALAPMHVRLTDPPFSPEKLAQLIREARGT